MKNRDAQRSTPAGCTTWVRLTWNHDSIIDSMRTTETIEHGQSVVVSLTRTVPSWMFGEGLLKADVNPGMRYVEKEGTDDNQAYLRFVVRLRPTGKLTLAAGPLGKCDAPLLLCGLSSVSLGKDPTGHTPADSARLVLSYWGLLDSVEHAADTTGWFPFCSDTTLTFPRGCGKYKIGVQYRDSGEDDSPFYPDSTDSIVVFDSVPPTGSIVINGGARFARSPNCTLRLAAQDSGSGVEAMRFSNLPRRIW